tara:strand:- start:1035 stop:1304 length:270 start_codon:yes stop_codon:yes gene_type:complete
MKLDKAIGTIPISALKGAIVSREDGSEMGYLGDITLDLKNMILLVDLIDFKDHKSRAGLDLTGLLNSQCTLHLNGSSLDYTPCDKDDSV